MYPIIVLVIAFSVMVNAVLFRRIMALTFVLTIFAVCASAVLLTIDRRLRQRL